MAASSKLCLCLCSFRNSSSCCCCSLSRCASSLLRGDSCCEGDLLPLAISSSSALHLRILERGESEEAGGEAMPDGLQLARGVEVEQRAAAAGDGEWLRGSRCLEAEAAVAVA